ncbi:MAG: ParA family protein [Alphaproteobacteria bacterium]|nr:ParA family protein [Alphaproteobacteria bacterium]
MTEPAPDQAVEPPVFYASRPRVIAVANQKGGVGKTTTAINVGTALAATGRRVLLIDLDPQGNASTGLGLDKSRRHPGAYEVLIGTADLAACAVPAPVPHLSIVPASRDLSGAEVELVEAERRAFRLREAVQALAAAPSGVPPYDYILIDCPPSLTLLTLNALVAADALLVPLQCEFLALDGLSELMNTVELVRANFNPKLYIQGVVLTMFDNRNRLSGQVAADVRAHLGATVYDTVIPRNVRVSEAPSFGLPVLLYDVTCAGAQAYAHLASEMLKREGIQEAAP